MKLEPEAEAALMRARQQILDAHGHDPNVNGAGIGFRKRGGELTAELVVAVFVVRKQPETVISRDRLLPKTIEIDGRQWGVDVIETGHVHTFR